MMRALLFGLLLLTGVSVTATSVSQVPPQARRVRARPPTFDREEVSRVFFDNLFDRLIGERPPRNSRREPQSAASDSRVAAATGAGAADESGGPAWHTLISAATLEDEVKSIRQRIDQTVTTPNSFAGGGYRAARQDFSLLAVLFAIIGQYGDSVRWRESAPVARDAFARSAANLKAGGSIQVFHEVRKRQQELDDLLRGSRLQGAGSNAVSWGDVVDRSLLMQLLESRLEANLKNWSREGGEFSALRDAIVREAELTAAIGAVLQREGMDDADDSEYREFARMLQRGATQLGQAARSGEEPLARQAVAEISRSCTECHGIYR